MIKEFIFEEGKFFRGCHAGTLASLKNDNILTAWFAGSHEGHTDTAIWIAKRNNGIWSAPAKVAKVKDEQHWNPVLFNPGNGKIYLFFKVGRDIPIWETWLVTSDDEGETWGKPEILVPGDTSGGRGPVKNKPIILSNGNWLAPGSVETKKYWQANVDISSDYGQSWQQSNLIKAIEDKHIIQPTVWESSPGNIHMLLRSTCGKILRSDSTDFGRNWTRAYTTDLPNNNSGIDLVKLNDCRLALIYNPTSNFRKRTPLRISLSGDNGKTWKDLVDLEDDDIEVGDIKLQHGGEFSYPSIIASNNGIACIYTWHRRRMVFCDIEID